MAARARWIALPLVMLLTGSLFALRSTPPVQRVALLAPFEGRYRDIGYQALYASRMALAETDRIDLELLAVDDGGSVGTAVDRARALSLDPDVSVVLLLGPFASREDVFAALGEKPGVVIGTWTDATFPGAPLEKIRERLDHPVDDVIQLAARDAPFNCGDLCQFEEFTLLRDDFSGVQMITRSPPVTDTFREQYTTFDVFAPEPLPIAILTYEMTRWTLVRLEGEVSDTPEWADDIYTYVFNADGRLTLLAQDTGDR